MIFKFYASNYVQKQNSDHIFRIACVSDKQIRLQSTALPHGDITFVGWTVLKIFWLNPSLVF